MNEIKDSTIDAAVYNICESLLRLCETQVSKCYTYSLSRLAKRANVPFQYIIWVAKILKNEGFEVFWLGRGLRRHLVVKINLERDLSRLKIVTERCREGLNIRDRSNETIRFPYKIDR